MSCDHDPTNSRLLVDKAADLGVTLDEVAAQEVLAFLDAMLKANQQVNLTAVRDREAAVVLHALDSLSFQLADLRPQRVLDLGTGNGFPGVGVAALSPRAAVTLMDRTGKKVRAIQACLSQAGIDRVAAIQMDASQAPSLNAEFRLGFDLCTARAVARPEVVARMAAPLVRPGGHIAIWLEADAVIDERIGDFRLHETIAYQLPDPAARARTLAVWSKDETREPRPRAGAETRLA